MARLRLIFRGTHRLVLGEGWAEDVTAHPATRAMVEEYALWYDRHFDPAWRDILLAPPGADRERMPWAFVLPRSANHAGIPLIRMMVEIDRITARLGEHVTMETHWRITDAGSGRETLGRDAFASAQQPQSYAEVAAAPFPGFQVPRMGQALRLLSARYAACEDGHHAALEALLALARTQAFRHRFTFLMLGLHERDPLRSLVRGIPRFTFSSQAFALEAIG